MLFHVTLLLLFMRRETRVYVHDMILPTDSFDTIINNICTSSTIRADQKKLQIY